MRPLTLVCSIILPCPPYTSACLLRPPPPLSSSRDAMATAAAGAGSLKRRGSSSRVFRDGASDPVSAGGPGLSAGAPLGRGGFIPAAGVDPGRLASPLMVPGGQLPATSKLVYDHSDDLPSPPPVPVTHGMVCVVPRGHCVRSCSALFWVHSLYHVASGIRRICCQDTYQPQLLTRAADPLPWPR